mmetsp:Transcript_28656/g.72908  ORF Transcript_28656/g.72908 Transcript_28656/m.72908 type:complete len:241 (-) Transcript_28656:268-990(-)
MIHRPPKGHRAPGGLGALLGLSLGGCAGRSSSSCAGRLTYSLSSSFALCLGGLSSPTTLPVFLVMKSRHVPTRSSRVASHSFSTCFCFLCLSLSSFSCPSSRAVSSLSRLVSFFCRHAMRASRSRALTFHVSWNSSVFSQAASTPSRPESLSSEATRTRLSCLVLFLRSLRTSSRARSSTLCRCSRRSSSISSFCASPRMSKAVVACVCLHLSGCTISDSFLYCLRTSSIDASNFRFSFS